MSIVLKYWDPTANNGTGGYIAVGIAAPDPGVNTQALLDAKAPKADPFFTGTINGVAATFSGTLTVGGVDLGAAVAGKANSSDLTTHTGSTAAHGASGAVVGTTNTQTLTNKTLTAPVISTISNGGTVTIPSGADTLVNLNGTQTLTNKRVRRRVTSLGAGTSYTPAGDTSDVVNMAAPTGNFTVAAPSGTPVDGQQLTLRLRMGTVVYTPTWNAIYISSGVATIPTSFPTASKTYLMSFQYDSTSVKWVLLAVDAVGY